MKPTLPLLTALLLAVLPALHAAETLTLPPDQRPEWLRRDGIVMAGSWEPLYFRVRRDGAPDYRPTPEQRAAYEREHSPSMVAKLKSLGVNFVMMHCHKGGGLEAERESMADAVRFAQLCHDAGLPVLVMAGCVALSDAQAEAIRRYVAGGGRLCVVGPLATHNEWMLPREKPALDGLPPDRVERVDENGDWLNAIRRAYGGPLSLSVTCDSKALCAELTEQPDRRLVHLVNYETDKPLKDIAVRVALPKGRDVKSVTLASPDRAAEIAVPFKQEAGFATFTVPGVAAYEIAVVTFSPAASAVHTLDLAPEGKAATVIAIPAKYRTDAHGDSAPKEN